MSIEIYVTSINPNESSSIRTEEEEISPTLGKREEDLPVKLKDLLTAVTKEIKSSVDTESQLTVEITGSMSFKAETGVKCFINASGEVGKTGTMKVSLTTTIKPENQQ